MQAQSALKEAKKLAQRSHVSVGEREKVIIDDLASLRALRADVEAQLTHTLNFRSTLDPVEADAIQSTFEKSMKLRHQIEKIGHSAEEFSLWCHKKGIYSENGGEIGQLDRELQNLRWSTRLDAQYPRLSTEPLRWRDDKGLPRLLPFSFYSPTTRLSVHSGWCEIVAGDHGFHRESQKLLENCYEDVFKLMEMRATEIAKHNWWRSYLFWQETTYEVSIEARFHGVIPTEIKKKIDEHKRVFNDLSLWFESDIFLIAEPQELKLSEEVKGRTKRLPKIRIPFIDPDPLVVVYYPGIDPKSFWLICDFDTTPVEEAMELYLANPR